MAKSVTNTVQRQELDPRYIAPPVTVSGLGTYSGDGISAIADSMKPAMEAELNQRYDSEKTKYQGITDEYAKGLDSYYNTAGANITRQADSQKEELPQTYQSAYDANAVQQAINQRQVAERMSNMGLTNSGTNRSQQTAINLMRSNADLAVRLKEAAAARSIEKQRDAQLGQYDLEKAAKMNDINLQTAMKLQDYYNSMQQNMDSNRYSMAGTIYGADRSDWLADRQNQINVELMNAQRAQQVEDRERNYLQQLYSFQLDEALKRELA